MKRNVILAVLAAVLLTIAAGAEAQFPLEILTLRHRTAEQVLPALRPLVEPGGTLSGQGSQLFVRASPGNLAELRRALDAIDRPARRLQISVRFDDAFDASRRSLGVSGRVGGDGTRVEIRARDAAVSGTERVDQRIQVLEGGHAMIYTGQSAPVRERRYIETPGGVLSQQVTVLHDTRTGFEVVPRLAGSMVQVDIVSANGTTTASGPLGRWFELGAVATPAGSRRVWIRVDAP
ncbi:MAG TPA: secretin N-terminal domain-containing protein [Burkholderiales bacterium]